MQLRQVDWGCTAFVVHVAILVCVMVCVTGVSVHLTARFDVFCTVITTQSSRTHVNSKRREGHRGQKERQRSRASENRNY